MQFANLKWHNQQPYSLDFNDVYYSSDDGLAETEYVFIKHNQLTERFSCLTDNEFQIIETGFGTGLNFFCAVQHWLENAPSSARLHFISIERYPLKLHDFIQANKNWPAFCHYIAQLENAYKHLTEGLNQLMCCENRVQLDLWIGDVGAVLPKIEAQADAWFLDGFAPSKNSDMWSEQLFVELSRLSKTNTSFATFTSASQVRRNLMNIGFNVFKVAGFGKKREMLYGKLPVVQP